MFSEQGYLMNCVPGILQPTLLPCALGSAPGRNQHSPITLDNSFDDPPCGKATVNSFWVLLRERHSGTLGPGCKEDATYLLPSGPTFVISKHALPHSPAIYPRNRFSTIHLKMAYTAAHVNKTNPGPYTLAFLNQNGPGDSRPTGLQIVQDNDCVGKLKDKVNTLIQIFCSEQAILTCSRSSSSLDLLAVLVLRPHARWRRLGRVASSVCAI